MRHCFTHKTFLSFIAGAVLCLSLSAVPLANAQESPIDTAGADLAHHILHKKQHSVAVFDFSGPGQQVSLLGQQLADNISAAIAKSSGNLRVEDRSQIANTRDRESFVPEIVLDPSSLIFLARDLNVGAMVTGDLALAQDGILVLQLKAFRVSDGKGLVAVKITMPVTPRMKSLADKSASPPLAGVADFVEDKSLTKAGYKPPTCVYCPHASYTGDAIDHRDNGTVELTATIGTDGTVKAIAVRKGMPDGLTRQSIETVKTWKLSPASSPVGKPIPARVAIMVSFQIFGGPYRH